MEKSSLFLLILFLISAPIYYTIATPDSNKITRETYTVIRVIDGDTLVLDSGQKVRLKGINTPEKGYPLSNESTTYLGNLINKTVTIENHGTDKYGRTLGFIFYQNQNINKEILSQGLASLYYYGTDSHFKEMQNAEEFARLNNLGIWKKSPNSNCITLKELKYKESPKRCTNDELIKIKNSCDFDIDIILKDDATHIYKETIKANQIFQKRFSCIWNDDGDTVYAWDSEGLLIFYRY